MKNIYRQYNIMMGAMKKVHVNIYTKAQYIVVWCHFSSIYPLQYITNNNNKMTSAQHNHYNTIKLSSYIVSTLASTVAPTLGPSSIDQVIVNHTNDILITNSGYSIIKAVNNFSYLSLWESFCQNNNNAYYILQKTMKWTL